MSLGDYLVGLAFALVTLGSALGVAAIVVGRRLAHLTGAAAGLAFATVACAALLGIHLFPGLVGILSRGSALVMGLVVLAVTWIVVPGRSRGATRLTLRRPGAGATVSLVGAAMATVFSVATAWKATFEASQDIDTMTFHLPDVIEWVQRGSIWHVDQFTPLLGSGNYPHNGDLLLLGTVMPFGSDAFVRAAGLPFLMVLAVSVYALTMEAGVRRSLAALVAAVVVSLPALQMATFEGAKTDAPMLALMGAGMYFLVRHLREPRTSNLMLAGVGLGIAFGTKWYALWCVVIVVAVWAVVAGRGGVPWRRVLRWAGAVTGLVALAGGIWLVRNAVESGSPLFPSGVGLGPLTLFDTPRDYVRECAGFSVLDYIDDPRVLRRLIYPAWRDGYAGPGLVLLLGWLTAGWLWARDRRRGSEVPPVVTISLFAAVLMALAYAAAPYSAIGGLYAPFAQANLRWLVPAAVPAAVVTGWALSLLPRARPVAEVLIVIAMFDALRRSLPDPVGHVLLPAAGIAAAGALAVVAVVLWRRHAAAARAGAVTTAALLAVALVITGYARQERYSDHRYKGTDAVIAALARHGGGNRRVALSGVWGVRALSPVLPAFGPRLRDTVEFLGPTVDGQLREYDNRDDYLAALRRGNYDLLVVGRNGYGTGCDLPGQESDDDAWAAAGGLRLLARTSNLSLYRAPG